LNPEFMTNRKIVFLKVVVWANCLLPLGKIIYLTETARFGFDPMRTVISSTGEETIWLLICALAITRSAKAATRLCLV